MNQKQWIEVDESSALNESRVKKSTVVISAVPALMLLLVGVLVGQWIIGVVVGAATYFLTARAVRATAAGILADATPMRVVADDEHSRLFNIIDGLCVVSGDQRPNMYVVDSTYPVAAAFIDAEGENAVLVSDAFSETMDRVEVEGVMAHLLWRLRTGNVALVAHVAAVSSLLGRLGLGSVARRIVGSYLSPDILMWADIFACQATRYPPALASALEKCAGATGTVELGAVNALCFALPTDVDGDTNARPAASTVVPVRSSIEERVAVLKEM